MRRRVPEFMTECARVLRREPTPAERALWRLLSPYRPPFTRQLRAGGFIIDLACRQAGLAVELDGSQHADAAEYDAARSAWLEREGWRVIRLWNSDMLSNPAGAAEFVLAQAVERLGVEPRPRAARPVRRRTG